MMQGEQAEKVEVEVVAGNGSCPGCGEAWDADGKCPRCLLSESEVRVLLEAGCAFYNQARNAAQAGRFADAALYLQIARQVGGKQLTENPAFARLEELCKRGNGSAESVPAAVWDEACRNEQTARHAVTRNDFRSAVFYAERAARLVPESLPLQKLYLLTLYGIGRMREAAELRRTLRSVLPGDADLASWQMAELDEWDRQELLPSPAKTEKKRVALVLAGCGAAVLAFWWGRRQRGAQSG
ncbi:MAG: hypothetical protein OHK0029_40440 [Armatimonadaceae bacterium]